MATSNQKEDKTSVDDTLDAASPRSFYMAFDTSHDILHFTGSGSSALSARAAAKMMTNHLLVIQPESVVPNRAGLTAVSSHPAGTSFCTGNSTASNNNNIDNNKANTSSYVEWRELIDANSMPEDDPNGNVNPVPGHTRDRWGPKHSGARQLASMYSWHKRLLELVSVTVGMFLMMADLSILLYRGRELNARVEAVLLAAVLGIVTADFLSGLVHWMSDTWGTVDMPIFGAYFIRPFREHHLDPTAITRHDFIEVNGDAFMLCTYKLGVVMHQHLTMDREQIAQHYHWHWFWLLLGFYVSITNQIHKWAHTYFGLHPMVLCMQKLHLILPRQHHKIHHVAPHAVHYCITTGWLNPILDYVHFWRHAENFVTTLTGARPRSDDMKWALKSSDDEMNGINRNCDTDQ